jgi:hypothetical protein
MPSKYGVISKAYIEPTKFKEILNGESTGILDLYVLFFDINNKLRTASRTLKQNLTTYLSQHRMISDTVNIKDAFIINIGISFDVVTLPNYNSNEVLLNCISIIQNLFDTKKWQINEPIILRDLYVALDNVDGTQTIKNIEITNKVGTALGYSEYSYDTKGATVNGVLYPSLDPMIFEVKYPNTDIQGRVVSF